MLIFLLGRTSTGAVAWIHVRQKKERVSMESQLAYNIPEACASARIGRTTLYEAIKDGSLRAVKRGRRTLILAEDLRDWIAEFPTKTPDRAQ
jgi:excisionase family DNA binding protein